jgi:hypothetical protein
MAAAVAPGCEVLAAGLHVVEVRDDHRAVR